MTDDQSCTPDPWSHVITLAAGLAHEIKNPLSTIQLNLQLLREDWQDADTPREKRALKRFATLQREAERLTALLEDFLRYARTQVVETEPVDINDLLDGILEFVAPQMDRLAVDVRTTLAPDLPALDADPKLLKQAILNLIINAEQAMPEGGELIVQTSTDGECVQIDITDTGEGILDHHLPKIFNVYFSTKKDGSGLGLPAARRIVELHQGTLEVESEPHKGTHFTIRLPVPERKETQGGA
jgi:signal transduction histidine kinase